MRERGSAPQQQRRRLFLSFAFRQRARAQDNGGPEAAAPLKETNKEHTASEMLSALRHRRYACAQLLDTFQTFK